MFRISVFPASVLAAVLFAAPVSAAFTFSVNPEDLIFNGPGTVQIPITVSNTSGESTISGFTFGFAGPGESGGAATPETDIVSGATAGLVTGTFLPFTFNNTSGIAAASNAADVDLGSGNSATLFTLEATVGNLPSYIIDVDFQSAERGGFFANTDISGEFDFGAGFESIPGAGPIPGVGFDSRLTLSAIPEPSSVLALGAIVGVGVLRTRRRRLAKKV